MRKAAYLTLRPSDEHEDETFPLHVIKSLEVMRQAYGDTAMAKSDVFDWHKLFREGLESWSINEQIQGKVHAHLLF